MRDIELTRPKGIMRTVAKNYDSLIAYSESFTFQRISDYLGIEEILLKEFFNDEIGLLKATIKYMLDMSDNLVFSVIAENPLEENRRIAHFLTLVNFLFTEHFECSICFKLYASSSFMLTDLYLDLIAFYDKWQQVVQKLLDSIVLTEDITGRIAAIYVDILRGCMLCAKRQNIVAEIFPAKSFLYGSAQALLDRRLVFRW